MADDERALDEPGIRELLSGSRRRASRSFVGGLVLSVGFLTAVSNVPSDDDRPWVVWPMVCALVAGPILMIAGAWALVRLRRQRRMLAAEPWRSVGLRYREVPSGNTVRGLTLVREDSVEHVLTLVSLARWNLRRTGLRTAERARIVGALPGYVVLHVDGAERIVSARPPYTEGGGRRWRRVFDN